MTPSAPETSSAASDDEQSLASALLLPIVVTPIVLFPLRDYQSLEPMLVLLSVVPGFALGMGFGVFLDRYRSRLQRWNDGAVIAVFVVPTFLVLVGMSRLTEGDVAGYQAIGLAALLWGTTLQSLLEE